MPTPATRRGRDGVVTLVLATLLVVSAVLVVLGQRASRQDLEQRIQDAATAHASFTETAIADLGRRQATAAEAVLAGAIGDEDLASVAAQLGVGFALVLDADGEVLAAHPPRELDGPSLLEQFPHLRRAVGGDVGVSATLEAPTMASGVAVAVAAPFTASDGSLRVLSTAFDRTETLLDRYLASDRFTPNSAAWLVDDRGGIVASGSDLGAPPATPNDPSQVVAVELRGREVAVAVAEVAGTPWSVVLASPTTEAFGPVAGFALWQPWLLLLGLTAIFWVQARLLQKNRRVGRELEEANLELEAAAERMRDFVAVAAHELRTPAGVILGYARRLAVHWNRLPDEDVELYTDRLARAARRLADLLSQLLVQATADRGELSLAAIDLDVAHEVATAVHDAGFVDADVRVDVPVGLAVHADGAHVRRILVNLLENAAKYGAPPIEIDAAPVGIEEVRIRVRDHGHGVPPEFAPHLFERFSRATPGQTPSGAGGAGLGLSVAAGVAREMGGSLVHEDATPGACFVLTLPSAPPLSGPAVDADVDALTVPEG